MTHRPRPARTPPDSRARPTWIAGLAALACVASLLFGFASPAQAEAPDQLVHTETLENGLEVIAIPDHSLPIVTIEVALRHGAFAESPEFDGLAHLYEHMCFKGNDQIPDQQAFLERIKELGIKFNGSTSTERVNYFYTLPEENLRKGMVLMKHSMLSPKFDEEEFKKEKSIVLSEYDRRESHPQHSFDRAMERLLWYEYPSRKIVLGTRETIADATVEQMRTIKERYYIPNNASLLLAGDVEAERAFELARTVFGDWEKGPPPFEENAIPEHPPLEEKKFLVEENDVEVPTVEFRWQGPSVDEDPGATYAADVLSFILSQSTSKFQKALVDSKIAYNADLGYYTQKYTGPISASAQVPVQNIEKAVKTLLREIHKLDDPEYYSDQQLENAKAILEARDIYGREKTSSFAHTVSFWWAVDDVDYYLSYIENLHAVTRKDIADYVSEYILDDAYLLGAVLKAKANEKLGLTEEKLAEIVSEVESDLDGGDAGASESSDGEDS